MDRLLQGYQRFRAEEWPERRATFERLAANGQRPRAMIIACSDSRVDPAMIFDAGPGELFVVRNVANLVPPYAPDGKYHGTSAALEFGIRVLEVEYLVVMGHAMCGGVRALLADKADGTSDFVMPWIRIAEPARARALVCDDPGERQTRCEHETVRLSLENLRTFPWIAERIAAGSLKLIGAYFGIDSGTLELLGPDGEFHPAK